MPSVDTIPLVMNDGRIDENTPRDRSVFARGLRRYPNRHLPRARATPVTNISTNPHLWSRISRCCF